MFLLESCTFEVVYVFLSDTGAAEPKTDLEFTRFVSFSMKFSDAFPFKNAPVVLSKFSWF